MEHRSDKDADPNRFRVIVTFDEQSNKKTAVTMRRLHPTRAQRDATIGFRFSSTWSSRASSQSCLTDC